MKYLGLIFIALLFSTQGYAKQLSTKKIVTVNGMVCSFCSESIHKKLKKRREILDLDFDMNKKIVSITFKPGKTIKDKTLTKLIKKSGFSVIGIKSVPKEIKKIDAKK